jgi:serine/threonine protein kinase/outer membrane murein-binding lipoprotein Lpp
MAQGTYGTVYRAVSAGQDEPVPVALKVARNPEDPRFGREAAVLSRLDHPNVPLLLDSGRWRHTSGAGYPYLTMAWVEGTPLYDWAREHAPTSRQGLLLLAGLARALQVTHATGAVHRDVKGGNVLVRHEDTQAVLMDFGSTSLKGAARLTWRTQPPGTPAYRSPEAWRFLLRYGLTSDEHYVATPADDLFALGVTAYRLVTGEYPPSTEPGQEDARVWEPEGSGPRPPRELNPRVEQQLSDLILRMLSVAPEARGTAKKLAEALEAAAEGTVPELDQPLAERKRSHPADPVKAEAEPEQERPATGEKAPAKGKRSGARNWSPLPWLAPVTGGLLVAACSWQAVSARIDRICTGVQTAAATKQRAEDPIAIGDNSVAAASGSTQAPSGKDPVASDTPEKTFPGQAKPDAKGKCPLPEQVALKDRCWVAHPMSAEACEGSGHVFEKGKCYFPAFAPRRKPTSSPSGSQ